MARCSYRPDPSVRSLGSARLHLFSCPLGPRYRKGDRAQFRVRRLLATDEQAPTCSASCVRSPMRLQGQSRRRCESTRQSARTAATEIPGTVASGSGHEPRSGFVCERAVSALPEKPRRASGTRRGSEMRQTSTTVASSLHEWPVNSHSPAWMRKGWAGENEADVGRNPRAVGLGSTSSARMEPLRLAHLRVRVGLGCAVRVSRKRMRARLDDRDADRVGIRGRNDEWAYLRGARGGSRGDRLVRQRRVGGSRSDVDRSAGAAEDVAGGGARVGFVLGAGFVRSSGLGRAAGDRGAVGWPRLVFGRAGQ